MHSQKSGYGKSAKQPAEPQNQMSALGRGDGGMRSSARLMTRSLTSYIGLAGAATVVTAVLFGLMSSLISDDFKPKDKLTLAVFEINAKPDDLVLIDGPKKPERPDQVDIPPAPPVIDVVKADQPSVPIFNPNGPNDIFSSKPVITKTVFKVGPSDQSVSPIVRTPPIMPPRATRSGHCKIGFDISPGGQPVNVKASYCTHNTFVRPAIRSVEEWTYRAKIQDGLPVAQLGMETIIRFHLTDDQGVTIPE